MKSILITSLALILFNLLACTSIDKNELKKANQGMEVITVGDMNFSVRIAGPKTGELVVLLHGFPQTSFSYRHQIKVLADAGYRVIAPDQRGYSEGARPPQIADYDIDLLVADVLNLAKSQGAKTFHLVGHDWGSVVAWHIADRHPEKLKTFTSLSIPHLRAFKEAMTDPKCEQGEKSGYIKSFVKKESERTYLMAGKAGLRMIYKDLPELDRDYYLEVLGKEDALRSALNWYRAYFGVQKERKPLGKVAVKTLLIYGEKDIAIGPCGVKNTAKYMKDGAYTLKSLPESGHWLLESDSSKISAWLLAHLK